MSPRSNKPSILNALIRLERGIAMLLDPEKSSYEKTLIESIEFAQRCGIDFFFVGGSTVTRQDLDATVKTIKSHSSLPIVIFPGSSQQVSEDADALLFLSLISGRNPDYLIGHHVAAASELYRSSLEIIPTGYILVDGGHMTSVSYVSQTSPIPRDQIGVVRSTAMAGILLGHQAIYLDAGSGAEKPVPKEMLEEVRELGHPLIVGGGIRSIDMLNDAHLSGANLVVVGNYLEDNPNFLLDIAYYKKTGINAIK